MNWVFTIYIAILFFILTPSILLRLPPKGNKYVVALVHAIVFAVIFHFTFKFVWERSVGIPTKMKINREIRHEQRQQHPQQQQMHMQSNY